MFVFEAPHVDLDAGILLIGESELNSASKVVIWVLNVYWIARDQRPYLPIYLNCENFFAVKDVLYLGQVELLWAAACLWRFW